MAAQITAPASGSQFGLATAVTFEGYGQASSGGAVQLQWESSLDGPLGQGSPLVVPRLGPGIHRIALRAVDAAGSIGEDTILVSAAGSSGQTGQDLLALIGSLAERMLGNPPRIPDGMLLVQQNPTRVNAAIGNGGLTAGVAADGTVTVLRWPSPSYDDHVDHLTTDRNAPRMGAQEDMGVFAGVAVSLGGGPVVSWFRDAEWTTTQTYLSADDNVLVTTHRHAGLDITVTEETFVHPAADVLTTRFEVVRGAAAPVADLDLVYFENLAPCTGRIPYLPVQDWLLDVLNDYGLFYHSADDALVHFRPKNVNYGALLAFAATQHADVQRATEDFLDQATAALGPGAAFAMGGDLPADAVRCGPDGAGTLDGGPAPLETAFREVSGGKLSGMPYSLIRASGAISRRLDLRNGPAAWTVHLAAAEDPDKARALLAWARGKGQAALLAETRAYWSQWIGRARLPNVADLRVHEVSKRSLITVKTATDRQTGAIVASIATQPPYALDWPRDGAFINRALDEAGYPEMVEAHNRFYARVQRQSGLFAGSVDMNFYADGTPGGPIPLEIDEAALLVWTWWDHARFMTDPAGRSQYLDDVYPAIARGADFLVRWRDPLSGLPLPANEDDHIEPTQGLQGSITAWLALDSAAAAARDRGRPAKEIQRYEGRRDELKRVIESWFYDAKKGLFTDGGPNGMGAAAWLIWPAGLLPATDARILSTAAALHAYHRPILDRQAAAGGYDAKGVLALASAWKHDPAGLTEVRRLVHILAHDLPTEGTLHYGEFYEVVNGPSGPKFLHLNDIPHVWEHALVYLAALEAYR